MVWWVEFSSYCILSVYMSKTPFVLETFETRNAEIPKNGFVIEMLLFMIFM